MDLKSANETYDNQSTAAFFLFDHKLRDFFCLLPRPFSRPDRVATCSKMTVVITGKI